MFNATSIQLRFSGYGSWSVKKKQATGCSNKKKLRWSNLSKYRKYPTMIAYTNKTNILRNGRHFLSLSEPKINNKTKKHSENIEIRCLHIFFVKFLYTNYRSRLFISHVKHIYYYKVSPDDNIQTLNNQNKYK